jgi:hypothetical protein
VITLNTTLSTPTWTATAQNGPSFKVLSGNPFTNIASVVASNLGPIGAYLLAGELVVNWAGMSYLDGDTVTIEFAPVPLPAGLGLVGLCLGTLGWAGRKRRPV